MSSLENNPFRSQRLFYRAIESPSDDDFFHALQADPPSFVNSTPSLVAPASRKYTQNTREHFQEALLGVIICLPTNPENRALAGLQEKEPEDPKKPDPPQSMVRAEPEDKGIPIGALELTPQHGMGPRYMHHRCADIGIDIAPKYQRRGYGGEALQWCLQWGFMHAGLHRIGIRVLGWNEGAFRLYQRVGFVVESRERERWWSNGRWWDDIGLGILEHEWRARYQGKDSDSRNVLVAETRQ